MTTTTTAPQDVTTTTATATNISSQLQEYRTVQHEKKRKHDQKIIASTTAFLVSAKQITEKTHSPIRTYSKKKQEQGFRLELMNIPKAEEHNRVPDWFK